MAKFTDYTQKTKPADADLLLIHDNAGAANKKTPFSGVWSWILDKLANAVISQLETTNKRIIPAINELNSKSLKYIATLGSDDSESLDSYIPADGHPAGFYKLYGVSIGGYNDLYGSMLLLGAESSKISTTQVYITSSMILVRTYVGNPLQWSRLMKYTGEILS